MRDQNLKFIQNSIAGIVSVITPKGLMRRWGRCSFLVSRFGFKNGFTLLEMVVSLGIFSVLIILALGIVLGVSNAQLKAANIQAIQDNIRFSLELITKELRTGTNYELTDYGTACGRVGDPDSEISFNTSLGEKRVYYLDQSGVIMRITGGTDCQRARPFTSEEVVVERLIFRLRGEKQGPTDGQPMVTVSLTARSRDSKLILESKMNLQTTVVGRLRDL